MESSFKRVLIICAHPDDETLGLGGTIYTLSKSNAKINCLIFTDGESARDKSVRIQQRKNQAISATKILGIKKTEFLEYKDQTLDIIPVVELAKKIELAIKRFNPDTVFTHFWGDVNQDHRRIFEATNIAVRATPNSGIKNVICFETPSSTEWGLESFKPNLFVDISKVLKIKINALKKYSNEIEKYPHPRSEESIKNRANFWGSASGKKQAEAFIIYRMIL